MARQLSISCCNGIRPDGTPWKCIWLSKDPPTIVKSHNNWYKLVKKIVEGRLQKRLAEVCLCNQDFDFEPTITVGKLLASKGIKILSFARYEVGEGMEKREENFAEEVMKQING